MMLISYSSSCLSHVIRKQATLVTQVRCFHYKFKRVQTPPLPEPRESPYIVGPYLKPEYEPVKYLTEPIKAREDNDLNYFIYEPIKVEPDESRTVKLLLLDDVEELGVAGQVVDAPYRLGASKLVALKKAEYATEFALKWHKFGPKTFQSASTALSPKTVRMLKKRVFDLPVSKEAIIKPWHLSLALRMAGCICPTAAIEDSSIEEYEEEENKRLVKCTIRINNHERVEVKFAYCSRESLLA